MASSIKKEMQDAAEAISSAAKAAVTAIASAAEDARKVVAANAAEAAKTVAVNNTAVSGDHDLIVELKVKVDTLIVAVASLSSKEEVMAHAMEDNKIHDGHDKAFDDHESRIRTLERNMWRWVGISSVGSGLLAIGGSWALGLIK